MRREARKLLDKAIDSLILSIEHFNRPDERGRVCAVLIFLDHAFEMFLKAAILEKGGKIGDPQRPGHAIGFDKCVSRGLSDGSRRFLSDDQATVLRNTNGQRDAAQHNIVEISEPMLYFYAQSAVTVFRDLLKSVFNQDLATCLPARVLPISTIPPSSLEALFDTEVEEVKKLLQPRTRRRNVADAKMRSLLVFENALAGITRQPSPEEIKEKEDQLNTRATWESVFPGVASIALSSQGQGHKISLYIKKKQEGIPVYLLKDDQPVPTQTLPEGTEGIPVVLKQVHDWDRYSLGIKRLAELVGITQYQAQALVWYRKIQQNPDYYKEFRRGSTVHKSYTQDVVWFLRDTLQTESLNLICLEYKLAMQGKKR